MPKITINNRSMHYLDEGEGPVLLLGHSYLWDHNMWREQVAELSQNFRCIVPDLWGHGDSDPLEGDVSIQTLADDHWQLMQALEIDRFSIIGLSVGGMWGTQLALDHPEAVEKLVIMDSYVGAEPEQSQQHYYQMLAMVEQLEMIPPPMIEQLIPIFLSNDTQVYQPQLVAHLSESLMAFSGKRALSLVEMGRAIFGRKDNLAQLAKITIPALVITGEFDIPHPPHETEQMAGLMTNSRFEIIPKAGHISALEQPEAVNDVLRAFL